MKRLEDLDIETQVVYLLLKLNDKSFEEAKEMFGGYFPEMQKEPFFKVIADKRMLLQSKKGVQA